MKKSNYQSTYILLVLLLVNGIASAQSGFNKVQTTNRNVLNAKESRDGIVGDPYLYKDFKKAFVKFNSGNSTPGYYEIKYDQLDDVILVKGKGTDEELSFSDPVVEFQFDDGKKLFRNGFSPVDKANEKSYFEVIYDGKTKYLKRNTKVIIEAKEYNSATTIKKIEKDEAFYIAKDNKLVTIKANEKSLIKTLGKDIELSKYIKDNKLNLKEDADMGKLLAYYDTL